MFPAPTTAAVPGGGAAGPLAWNPTHRTRLGLHLLAAGHTPAAPALRAVLSLADDPNGHYTAVHVDPHCAHTAPAAAAPLTVAADPTWGHTRGPALTACPDCTGTRLGQALFVAAHIEGLLHALAGALAALAEHPAPAWGTWADGLHTAYAIVRTHTAGPGLVEGTPITTTVADARTLVHHVATQLAPAPQQAAHTAHTVAAALGDLADRWSGVAHTLLDTADRLPVPLDRYPIPAPGHPHTSVTAQHTEHTVLVSARSLLLDRVLDGTGLLLENTRAAAADQRVLATNPTGTHQLVRAPRWALSGLAVASWLPDDPHWAAAVRLFDGDDTRRLPVLRDAVEAAHTT